MAEKTVQFTTSLSVRECGEALRSAITEERGLSSRIGGLTARLMGGEALTWFTPEDKSPFASLDEDPPTFCVGVGVPKAGGAHAKGSVIHLYVWNRGEQREVALWAYHSLAGGSHARKLMDAARSRIER